MSKMQIAIWNLSSLLIACILENMVHVLDEIMRFVDDL